MSYVGLFLFFWNTKSKALPYMTLFEGGFHCHIRLILSPPHALFLSRDWVVEHFEVRVHAQLFLNTNYFYNYFAIYFDDI
jgi:hypothetical protein